MVGMSRAFVGVSTTLLLTVTIGGVFRGQTTGQTAGQTAASPQTAREWRQAAAARRQAKDFDGAIAALQMSLKLEPDSPTAMFALGAIYAAKGGTAQSLEWLTRARATRRIDMTQMEADNDLKGLVGDARFAALLP